jgi:hypothetical protein
LGLLYAQSYRGEISGTVKDATGAVVPGAKITVTDEDRGVTQSGTTTAEGAFHLMELAPGRYQVAIQHPGFRTLEQKMTLEVAQNKVLDAVLTLGDIASSVEVKDEAALLEPASGAVGTLIDSGRIADLPLNGRNAFELVGLSPGIVPMGSFGQSDPWDTRSQAAFSASGSRGLANDLLLDGASTTGTDYNSPAFTPSLDSIQEFRVQMNAYAAEYGRSQGAVVNAVTMSGNNKFHGSVYDYLRNQVLDANQFFNNAAGQKRGTLRWNQFGGRLGGPVRIPKYYDGRNRTFFIVTYEGMRYARGVAASQRVPTPLERNGDFTQTVDARGAMIPIFDPWSSRLDPARPGRYVRTAFPGNRIPLASVNTATGQAYLNPVAAKVMSYYPLPNQTPLFAGGANFFFNGNMVDRADKVMVKVDRIFSPKHRTSFRFNYTDDDRVQPRTFGNEASPVVGPNDEYSHGGLVEHVWLIRPTLVATVRASVLRAVNDLSALSAGFLFADKLGLPKALQDAADFKNFPTFDVPSMPIGVSGPPKVYNVPTSPNLSASVFGARSRHAIKTGMEYRAFFRNNVAYALATPPSGTYGFNQAVTGGPDPDATGTSGYGFASFLLGVPSGGSFYKSAANAMKSSYWAAYVQDDWRVSAKLTFNLGVRWDRDTAMTERYNRNAWLDFTSPSPVEAAVNARYQPILDQLRRTNPAVAAVLPASLQLRGGLVYARPGDRGNGIGDWNNFGPRFGFAYAVGRQWVLRGGYGVFFTPQTGAPFNDVQGYQANTPAAGLSADRTPQITLSNPFPGGLIPPSGNSLGLATNVGADIASWNKGNLTGYAQQWNFNVQRGLMRNTIVEVGYLGSHGVKLLGQDVQWDSPSRPVVDLGPTILNTAVGNPLQGVAGAATVLGRQATVTVRQLLLPYPQFTSVLSRAEHLYNGNYHAMTLRLERRMTDGLAAMISYTAGKSIDDGSGWAAQQGALGQVGLDVSNRRLDRSLSSYDRSQRLVVSTTYALPFGAGRRWGAGSPMGRLLGGWQVNGIYTWMTGAPLIVARSAYLLRNPDSPDNGKGPWGLSAANPYLSSSALRGLVAGEVSNIPRTMPNLRAPGMSNLNASFFKIFRVRETLRMQLRAEMFNAFNHTQFAPPNSNWAAPTFGLISATSQRAREMQLGARLEF